MTQKKRLTDLEGDIHKNRRSFYAIGIALREIRDDRLYRVLLFQTFETYTRARWEIGKSQAYRLIEACRIVDNLSPIGDILPENEAQLRSLAPLDPAAQRKTWGDFLKTDMELSAFNLRKFIASRTADTPGKKVDRTGIISDAYKITALSMLEQIRSAQNDGWQATSREAALFWNRVMKEKIVFDAPDRGEV
ncbi:DNA methylase [Desulfoluna sp.]|uniref:DNA methylase n=1 Tax=Desulfoluna sp. TaxID=2045199 RepID=UPI002626CA7A|nr:DNA methylase [Desulfoluna sp.]